MGSRAGDAESELIAAAQRGDRCALDALVRRHQSWVRNVVYATLGRPTIVDDVVQTVWTKVWQQIGTLIEPQGWRNWLYTMARNAAIDAGLAESRQGRNQVALDAVGDVPSSAAEPHRCASAKEDHARVLAAIRGLPAIYREPFILRHLDDWSYAEIAEAMSIPVDTVETRLVRARRLLRAALSGAGEDRRTREP